MSAVTLDRVGKRFGAQAVVDDVSLAIADGEFVVFVGPSGSGKSTLLRLIAGLETPGEGEIRIGARRVNELAPGRRGIAMVFQSYALYPHLSVRDNLGFALRMAGRPRAEIAARVQRAAEVLQIEALLERLPRALSGGQRQRVAIGRAIVREPEVFLFDEPLSNLDASLRQSMRVELATLHQRLGATMLYVTHDQVEAMTLADRLVVFDGGRVQQVGPPAEVYERPANVFVAGFLGAPRINLLPGDRLGAAAQGAATLGVRPEHWQLAERDGLAAQVELVEYLGDHRLAYLRVPGLAQAITLKQSPAEPPLRPGQALQLDVAPDRLLRFDDQGRALHA